MKSLISKFLRSDICSQIFILLFIFHRRHICLPVVRSNVFEQRRTSKARETEARGSVGEEEVFVFLLSILN